MSCSGLFDPLVVQFVLDVCRFVGRVGCLRGGWDGVCGGGLDVAFGEEYGSGPTALAAWPREKFLYRHNAYGS